MLFIIGLCNFLFILLLLGAGYLYVQRNKAACLLSLPSALIITDQEYTVLAASQGAKQLFPSLTVGSSLLLQTPLPANKATDPIWLHQFEPPIAIKASFKPFQQRICVELHDVTQASIQANQVQLQSQIRQQFTADIAHDLRSPIQVVTGFIEAMQDGLLEATPQRFAAINHELKHLSNMITDFLLLAKAESGDLQLSLKPCDINELLHPLSVIYDLKAQQQQKNIQVALSSIAISVHVDRTRFLQIMHNLIENAFAHTHEHDTITISIEQTAEETLIKVADSGVGMSEQQLAQLFRRGYRGKSSLADEKKSNGLGLHICQSLVQAHQGKLQAQSAGIGQGSQFIIHLPRTHV